MWDQIVIRRSLESGQPWQLEGGEALRILTCGLL